MEKKLFKRILLLAFLMTLGSQATFAQDFSAVNDEGMTLCYNILYEDDEPTTMVELTSGGKITSYSGVIVVPSTVVNPNDGQTYTVAGIGENAVYDCDQVTSVQLPNTIIYIGNRAFYDCDYLQSINFPEGLVWIGQYAFTYAQFSQVVLPSTLEYLDSNAFQWCYNIQTVICKGTTPPELGGTIFRSDVYYSAKLLVPATALEAYQNADGWGTGKSDYFINIATFEEGQTLFGFSDDEFVYDIISQSGRTAVVSGSAQGYWEGDIELPETAVCTTEDGEEINFTIIGLGSNVFNYNNAYGLRSVEIPASYTQYGLFAFNECRNLKRILVKNPVPVSLEYPIVDNYVTHRQAILYVPKGSLDAYQNAPFWGYVPYGDGEVTPGDDVIKAPAANAEERKAALEEFGKRTTARAEKCAPKGNRRKDPSNAGYGFMNIREYEEGQLFDFEDEGILYSIVSWTDRTVEVAPGYSNGGGGYYEKAPRKEPLGYIDYSGDIVIPAVVTYMPGSEYYDDGGSGGEIYPKAPRKRGPTEPIDFTVVGVASQAFNNNYNINTIELPATIESIGAYAFNNCGNLQRIIVKNPTPVSLSWPIADQWGVYSNTVLYVPQGSLDAYRNAPFWGVNGEVEGGGEIIDPKAPRKIVKGGDAGYFFDDIREYVEGQIFGFTLDGITYEVTDFAAGEVIVVQSTSEEYSGDIVIPENPVYESKQFTTVGIGPDAFNWCSSVTSVQLPSTIRTIGSQAFYSCQSMTSINLPDGLYSIGYGAFYNCKALQTVNLGNNLTAIEDNAFAQSGITAINIPTGVEYIGNYAFNQCTSLANVTIGDGVQTIGEYVFSNCTALTSVTMGEGVESIGQYSFQGCSVLSSIQLASTITTMGQSIFYGCSALTSIALPEQLTAIPAQAFYNCSSLKSLTMGDLVTSVGSNALYNTKLETVRLSGGLSEIPDQMFNGVSTLKSVEMGSGVTRIGHRAFQGCSSLETFDMPSTINTLGDYAFAGCSKIQEINLSGVVSFGQYVFQNCSALESVTFSPDLERIPDYLLSGSGLKTIVIPEGVKDIGVEAFYNCTVLTTVELPSTLTTIADRAFKNCSALVTADGSSGLIAVGEEAFSGCSKLGVLTLPEGMLTIGTKAFYGCSKLNPHIASTLTSLGSYAFYSTAITNENAVWPAALTTIPEYTFRSCSKLTAFTIPAHVESIGDYAFAYTGLTEINLPATVKTLGGYMFYYSKLTKAVVEEGHTKLPNYMFYACESLVEVQLPSTLTEMGNNAFYVCSALPEIQLPDALKTMGSGVFRGCTSLKSIVFPAGLETMGSDVLNNCTSLIDVTLPTAMTKLPSYTFAYCSKLPMIVIPDNITDIGSSVFYNCTTLADVFMPSRLNSIGTDAFEQCTSLRSMEIPEGITELPSSVFYGCSTLKTVKLPSTLTTMNYSSLSNCSALTKIYMKATTPPASSSSSSWSHTVTATVYVPTESIEAYQAAFPWNKTNYTIVGWTDENIVIAQEDWQILKTIYQKANSDLLAMKWQLGESYQEVTSLRGVELDANGHVTDINLAANNVAEDILPDVLQLPQVAYIDISNNDIGCNLDDLLGEGQVLNVQKTSVTMLRMANNHYEGNIGAFAQMLPNLTTINVSRNRISEINPLFSSKVTSRIVNGQQLDLVLNFKEFAQATGNYRYDVMPRILSYSQENNTLTSNTAWFRIYNGDTPAASDFNLLLYKNANAGVNVYNSGEKTIFRGEQSDVFNVRALAWSSSSYVDDNGHSLKIIMDYEPGDINYSGTLDVNDVQYAINIAVNAAFTTSNYYYSLSAGDLMADESINVIDVVRIVNRLLDDQSTVGSAPRREAAADDEDEVQAPDLWLYIQDGQLMMQADKTVGALDLTLSSDQLADATWMPGNGSYGATTRSRNGLTRAIVCAMNGDSLQAGTTLLADFSQLRTDGIGISRATASSPDGQPLVVAIVNNDTDGISQMENGDQTIDNSAVYDLSGRIIVNRKSVNRKLPKGLYIVNGKKQVIK